MCVGVPSDQQECCQAAGAPHSASHVSSRCSILANGGYRSCRKMSIPTQIALDLYSQLVDRCHQPVGGPCKDATTCPFL